MNTREFLVAASFLPKPVRAIYGVNQHKEWNEAIDNYMDAEFNLRKRWIEWLKDTYAFDFSEAVQEEIYKMAWVECHQDGYAAVEERFEHYSKFAILVVENVQ